MIISTQNRATPECQVMKRGGGGIRRGRGDKRSKTQQTCGWKVNGELQNISLLVLI